jgi:hypothetical protein
MLFFFIGKFEADILGITDQTWLEANDLLHKNWEY